MPEHEYVVTQPFGEHVVGTRLTEAPDAHHASRVVRVTAAEKPDEPDDHEPKTEG